MGWEIVGGDPAPGSPESVGSASTALSNVATFAEQARTDLITRTGAAGIEHWKGSAADAFRADVHKLPGDLNTLSTSYASGAAALSTFRTVLEKAQSDARGILSAAQQAKTDRDNAESRRKSAQADVDALTLTHLKDEASLKALQLQQTASIDPAHRAGLTAPINSARTRATRTAADLNSAKQSAAHYAQLVRDADARLTQAHQRADAVRATVATAVGSAVATLQQAERDAHLPSFWSEKAQQAKQLLHKYGPEVIHYLDIAQTVFSVLAMFPTPLSGVFAGLALGCGITALALSFAVDATSADGLTGHDMFDLGGRLLGVVGGGAAMRAAKLGAKSVQGVSLAEKAATWRNVSTAASWGKDAADVGKETVDDGWQGGARAAGGILLGRGVEFGVAKGVTSAAKVMNSVDQHGDLKYPKAATLLAGQSKSLREHADSGKWVNATRSDDVHTLQSVMATGRQSGGQMLFGNNAATHPTLNDHMMSDKDVTGFVGGALEDDQHKVVDMVKTLAAGTPSGEPPPPPHGPEIDIDIDLAPSPYGNTP